MALVAATLIIALLVPILPMSVTATSADVTSAVTASVSRVELKRAIALFARFNPRLLRPNRPARLLGRKVKPSYASLAFRGEPGSRALTAHLAGALVGGELEGLEVLLGDGLGTTFDLPHHEALSNPSASGAETVVHSAAFIAGAARPDTDVLVRPIPLGFSVYVQFRSASAPEQFKIADRVTCSSLRSEVIRRVRPGTFSLDRVPDEGEVECEPYSHAPVAPVGPIDPTDTASNYVHEHRLIALARRQASREHLLLLDLVSATPARDASGRVVPTEMSWRDTEMPVLRVHLHAGHYHYPVLARVDFIVGDR